MTSDVKNPFTAQLTLTVEEAVTLKMALEHTIKYYGRYGFSEKSDMICDELAMLKRIENLHYAITGTQKDPS